VEPLATRAHTAVTQGARPRWHIARARPSWAGRGAEFDPGAKMESSPFYLFLFSFCFLFSLIFQIPKLNSNSCLNFEFTILTRIILLLLVISSSHYLILAMVNDFNTIPFLFSYFPFVFYFQVF
jgi:hypothetical protein